MIKQPIYADVKPIKVKSIRKLLLLQYFYPEASINMIMRKLKCSQSSAYDYYNALKVIRRTSQYQVKTGFTEYED